MQWRKTPDPNRETVDALVQELIVPRPIAQLLAQRGISDFDSAKHFFRPQWSQLYDPFLMQDMDAAVQRIQQAIEAGEAVMVFGDYDVDGTTAVALVTSYLKDKITQL